VLIFPIWDNMGQYAVSKVDRVEICLSPWVANFIGLSKLLLCNYGEK
jgi:hypothetical protein